MKNIGKDKHSSLFSLSNDDEEKGFIALMPERLNDGLQTREMVKNDKF
jgi:hypothetical protein